MTKDFAEEATQKIYEIFCEGCQIKESCERCKINQAMRAIENLVEEETCKECVIEGEE